MQAGRICSPRRMNKFMRKHKLNRHATWTGLWACIILYGSFVPFHFSTSTLNGLSLWELLTTPQWVTRNPNDVSSLGIPGWMSDMLVNIALYLPLGLFLFLWLSKEYKNFGKWGYVIFALPGLMLSYCVEVLQVFSVDRVSTIQDILCNGLGTLLGCIAAVKIYSGILKGLFHIHCKLSYPLYRMKQVGLSIRRNPKMMLGVSLINIAILGYWYLAYRASSSVGTDRDSLIPFANHFRHSYDVALFNIGEALVIYMMVTMLISTQFMRRKMRARLSYVILCIGLLAMIREWILTNTVGARADLTEPILAMMGAGFLCVSLYLFYHAIQCYDRRKERLDVDRDRRRVPYAYEDS